MAAWTLPHRITDWCEILTTALDRRSRAEVTWWRSLGGGHLGCHCWCHLGCHLGTQLYCSARHREREFPEVG